MASRITYLSIQSAAEWPLTFLISVVRYLGVMLRGVEPPRPFVLVVQRELLHEAVEILLVPALRRALHAGPLLAVLADDAAQLVEEKGEVAAQDLLEEGHLPGFCNLVGDAADQPLQLAALLRGDMENRLLQHLKQDGTQSPDVDVDLLEKVLLESEQVAPGLVRPDHLQDVVGLVDQDRILADPVFVQVDVDVRGAAFADHDEVGVDAAGVVEQDGSVLVVVFGQRDEASVVNDSRCVGILLAELADGEADDLLIVHIVCKLL